MSCETSKEQCARKSDTDREGDHMEEEAPYAKPHRSTANDSHNPDRNRKKKQQIEISCAVKHVFYPFSKNHKKKKQKKEARTCV